MGLSLYPLLLRAILQDPQIFSLFCERCVVQNGANSYFLNGLKLSSVKPVRTNLFVNLTCFKMFV
jgi:hypothetical protein